MCQINERNRVNFDFFMMMVNCMNSCALRNDQDFIEYMYGKGL